MKWIVWLFRRLWPCAEQDNLDLLISEANALRNCVRSVLWSYCERVESCPIHVEKSFDICGRRYWYSPHLGPTIIGAVFCRRIVYTIFRELERGKVQLRDLNDSDTIDAYFDMPRFISEFESFVAEEVVLMRKRLEGSSDVTR